MQATERSIWTRHSDGRDTADALAVARILGIDPDQADIVVDTWPLDWEAVDPLPDHVMQTLLDGEGAA